MVEAVFFDLVGTLVYIEETISFEDSSSYLLSRGYEISPQQFKASWLFVVFVDHPRHCYESWKSFLDRILWRLDVSVDEETLRGLVEMFKRHRYVMYPDTVDAVPQIKNLGLKTAIVTTTPRFMFYESIEPIRDHIDYIATGCETGCDKSNPKMYLKVLEVLKVDPEECVVVGDDIQLDAYIPRKLGMYTILLDQRYSHSSSVANMIARDLKEVVEGIRSLIQSSQLGT